MENVLSPAPLTVRTFGASWPLLVALLALIGVLGHPRPDALLSDGDTYWHLATGSWIVEHGAVPKTDPFSHSMPGATWTAHEWLSELMLYGVQHVAGWAGLVVAASLLFAATLAYLMRFLLARMEPVHALLFTALAAGMLMGHLLARPHVFAWPLLAVWVGTLVDASENRRGPPWWLLALMVVWANLHGSFTLGLALGAALALEAVLACPVGQRSAAARRWVAFVALSVLASMVTPSGWQGIWYTVQVMRMTVALEVIDEWRSPDFHRLQPLELWLMLMLAIACAGRMRLPWMRLLLVLGLIHLALKHQRNVAVLGLVSPLLMATPLANRWRATTVVRRDADSLDRFFLALAAPARPSAVVAAALVAALLAGAALQSKRFAPVAERSPAAAVQAALRAGAHGPVLNDYGFGGYLIYSGVPVFIDGRADMYGDALLNRQINALMLRDPSDLPRLLDDYRIGWTLLPPGTPALAALDQLPGWRRVHADAVAVVHVHDVSGAVR
jgi:hypothetical protein